MNGVSYINNAIEKKLLDLNVAFIAKVLSISGTTAKIQPLGMIKQFGETAKAKSPVTNVPIIESAQYRLKEKEIEHVTDVSIRTSSSDGYLTSASLNVKKETETILVKEPLKAGDIVFCVCADRDITESQKGNNATPSIGHHSMSDCVIVGIL